MWGWLFRRVAGRTRPGWCQGWKRRSGKAWCDPSGQLWPGEPAKGCQRRWIGISFQIWFSTTARIMCCGSMFTHCVCRCALMKAQWQSLVSQLIQICMAFMWDVILMWRCLSVQWGVTGNNSSCLFAVFGETPEDAGDSTHGQHTSFVLYAH